MLGLGLAVTVGKRILGNAIDALFSLLNGRATYYENASASKSTIKAIDNADILDKATILLTPTATSNARVHSVKTYTGDELVTNGTFDTDSDWTKGSGWSIVNGEAVHTGSGDYIEQGSLTEGNKYKVVIIVTQANGSGFPQIYMGGLTTAMTSPDTYTFYITAQSGDKIKLRGLNDCKVDSISVIDVSSDFDFDRASSATRINSDGLVQDMQSITDPELVLNGDFEELGDEEVTNGTFDADSNWSATNGATITGGVLNIDYNLGNGSTTQSNVFTIGKTYKIQLNVDDSSTGTARIDNGVPATLLSNGLNTFYIVATGTTLEIRNHVDFVGSIDNVSVQQVNVDSEGNDIWSLGTGWSIEDGKLVGDGTMTASDTAVQSYNFTDGNTYKFSFEITERTQGSVFIREPFNGVSDAVGTVGTHTFNYVAGAANELKLRSDDNFTGKIDNISLKDITFSTDVDLARINYDSNGDNGHILLEPTSTNLVGYSLPNNTNWSKGINTTITENYAVSPDGTQNASRLVMPTGSGTYAYYQFTATSTTNHTLSFYAKNNGGDADVIMAFFVASQTQNITLTNEWQRFEFTTSITSGNSVQVGVDNITSVDMLIYGVQCEALPYATSYIPTLTGSTVTRAAETLNGSGNSTLINSTEGVLYAEIAALNDDSDIKGISLGNLGTNVTTNGVAFYLFDNNLRARAYDSDYTLNGGVYFEATKSSISTNTFYKVAISWDSNGGKMYVDGALITPTRNLSGYGFAANYLNSLNFYRNSNDVFEGKCKALAVFNEALEDDELELLTGVTNYGSFGELASANGYTII